MYLLFIMYYCFRNVGFKLMRTVPRRIPNYISYFDTSRPITTGFHWSALAKSKFQQMINVSNSLGDATLNLGNRMEIVEYGLDDIVSAVMRSIKSLSFFIIQHQNFTRNLQSEIVKINLALDEDQNECKKAISEIKVKMEAIRNASEAHDLILGVLVGLCLLVWVLKWLHDACFASVKSFRRCSKTILPGCCRIECSEHKRESGE